MILFKEFEIEDWWQIDDPIEPFAIEKPLDILSKGICMTATEDGKVMACGGIVLTTDIDGLVWCKVSKKCLTKSLRWARTMKEAFNLMMNSVGDFNISTYILDGFCKGDKLARLIGLKKTNETESNNGNTYYKYTAVI